MSEQPGIFPTARSWREIPQEVAPRAMSKTGRRRYTIAIAKVVAGVAFAGAVTWGAVSLITAIEYHPASIARADDVGPVKPMPDFTTDGVLTAEWAAKTLAIPKTASLMELNLSLLQSRLLASGQVRVAVLEKRFPDTLVVKLNERTPVARVMVQDGSSAPTMYFAARDGVVFQGDGYARSFIEQLPWLDGVHLARQNGRFEPIQGMDAVASLIAQARYESQHLYSLFRVISLARFASDGLIEVRSPVCQSVEFTTHEDFFRQLAYFDYICDAMKPTPDNPLARIDLSLGRNVPVAFRDPVGSHSKGAVTRSTQVDASADAQHGSAITFPSLFQRNPTQREL
ncbi:cell division protein FtsQ [mine drainage metagenome]|uniref:Cell division protein FtsQ n=1 Tax=mine drainage metagenome TaxID=410659 RepID=A0A1J5TCE9_9ZZZZ